MNGEILAAEVITLPLQSDNFGQEELIVLAPSKVNQSLS